jgi:NAD(P)-dependent dehydrogenase (short-subunit alcohol dehydrogenase family)
MQDERFNMILVTGATETNGRELIKQLADSGVGVRAMVRNAAKHPEIIDVFANGLAGKPRSPAPRLECGLFGLPPAGPRLRSASRASLRVHSNSGVF